MKSYSATSILESSGPKRAVEGSSPSDFYFESYGLARSFNQSVAQFVFFLGETPLCAFLEAK